MNNSERKIEEIIRLMQTDDSVDAPHDAIKWSKNLWKTRTKSRRTSIVERVTATLLRELLPGSAMAGERSGSAGRSRQMLYEAGDNRIDLRLTPSEDGFTIRGQILGTDWEEGRVEIAEQTTELNTSGGFVLHGVKGGTYDIELKGPQIDIVLPGVKIG